MVCAYEDTRDALTRLLGVRVLEDGVDRNPRVSRRGGMTWIGDAPLDLGQPIGVAAPTARFLMRHGPGMSAVAVRVSDLQATAEHLEDRGVRFTWADPTFGFSHPHDTAGVLLQWFEGTWDHDPRRGGPIPEPVEDSVLDVTRLAFVGAVVDEPEVAARLLADLLGTTVMFLRPDAPLGTPRAGVSLGDVALGLYTRPDPADAWALWGMELAIPRVHSLAVLVPDLAGARAALAAEGIVPIRDDGTALVLPLGATGDLCIVATDRLLPNDLRAGA